MARIDLTYRWFKRRYRKRPHCTPKSLPHQFDRETSRSLRRSFIRKATGRWNGVSTL